MTGRPTRRSALSLAQQARGRRYIALYTERFGRAPSSVPTTVYLEDAPDREELT